MEAVDTSERLAALRALMQERKVDVYSWYPGWTSGKRKLGCLLILACSCPVGR
jgi:hypothetical protein